MNTLLGEIGERFSATLLVVAKCLLAYIPHAALL